MKVLKQFFAVLLTFTFAGAEIVDRIAVVVDRSAIKQSDILRDIRLTAFVNGEKPDLSLAEQKKAASRLIDQAILRKEVTMGRYPEPDSAQIEQLFLQIRQRFRTQAAFDEALTNYGITADQMKEHLRWQAAVLQFVALRFSNGNVAAGSNADVNRAFFNWLDETRKQTRLVFIEEDLK